MCFKAAIICAPLCLRMLIYRDSERSSPCAFSCLVRFLGLDNNGVFSGATVCRFSAVPNPVDSWCREIKFHSWGSEWVFAETTPSPLGDGHVPILETIRCAARALRKEVFQFSFRYPLDVVPGAGPKDSLDYYFYSDKLAWEAMRMDSNGVPRAWYRQTGAAYWPAYIAWYGLVNLGHYLRRKDPSHLEIFLKQVDWLERTAIIRADRAVVWPMNFDYLVGQHLLKAPWISAHAQGFVISALVRGWRVTRRPRLLELLAGSARIFSLAVPENGVRITLDGHILYTETPGSGVPGILDGFMISLLGLYDLLVEMGDPGVARLFEEGVAGLKSTLPYWNYRDKWSWYHNREYLCPPAYHCLHHVVLKILARLTGEPVFADYASRWEPARLSTLDRAEIYPVFLYTKNRCRLKHRTWNQTAKPPQLPDHWLSKIHHPHCGVDEIR
jgi:heparosan-N-sulfate-glucuronate 5-epimerase